jgi:copper chaperone CopZ
MRIASDYVHALNGRLRIKVAEVKGRPQVARFVEEQLRSLAGITEVTANPTTGNVLVLYEPARVTQQDVVRALHALGCLRRVPRIERPTARRNAIVGHVAQTVARATVEMALQRVVYALVCVA